ncbi:MAG: hypothetical protein MJ085_06445 [Clostridia bacterium]|nr:hypothetical protein [Clostridia bacterium]
MRSVVCVLLVFLMLTFAGQLPFEIHDAAELAPIRTLQVEASGQGFLLRGENGQQGSGETFELAVEDLKKASSGVAFLQTAQKIILSGSIDVAVEQVVMSEALRPSSEVYTAQEQLDLEQVTAYLSARSSDVTLSDLRSAVMEERDVRLPRLVIIEERVELRA